MPKEQNEVAPLSGSLDAVAAKMVRPSKGLSPKAPKPRKNARADKKPEKLIEGHPEIDVLLVTSLTGDERRAIDLLDRFYPPE